MDDSDLTICQGMLIEFFADGKYRITFDVERKNIDTTLKLDLYVPSKIIELPSKKEEIQGFSLKLPEIRLLSTNNQDVLSKLHHNLVVTGFSKKISADIQSISINYPPCERLTFSSGYGAGIHAPGWYELLWKVSRNNRTETSVLDKTGLNNNSAVVVDKNNKTDSTMIEPDTLSNNAGKTNLVGQSTDSSQEGLQPFVVMDGLTPKPFSTLSEAVEFAADGSIIEVDAAGTTLENPLLEKQIQIRSKSIVIRGKSGATPVLAFNDESYFFPGSIRLLQGAKLKLQNIHLLFTCDHGVITEQVSLFNLQQPRGLVLENVSLTLNNPARKSCQMIQLASNSDEAFLEIPRMNDVGAEPISIELTNCLIWGHGDFLTAKTSRSVACQGMR